MAVSIQDHQLPCDTHNTYTVTFDTAVIQTLVTHTPSVVDCWISDVTAAQNRRHYGRLVGLDVEWRPNFNRQSDNPVATLQLCIGNSCLIFQIMYAPYIPRSLADFLGNPGYTFVGVGIDADAEKLLVDYNLSVANAVDLRQWAAERGMMELRNAGLKEFARVLLGKDLQKPRRVTMSRWDSEWLYPDQVQYACVDAFVSFEIGRVLNHQ